eukprot:gb/GECG01002893.1/.p1 GENE.gb/GECG01002893.1/~~gb/GECG01002893.1/.p1  ORF type:complete len:118 (+),score=6.67 gb/GECG01002893.1/:1-354(+)
MNPTAEQNSVDRLLAPGDTISHEELRKNTHKAKYLRMALTILFACAAGILGVTGVAGFGLYAIAQLTVSAVVALLCKGDTFSYFGEKPLNFVISGFTEELISYILFWTLLYALVHIY